MQQPLTTIPRYNISYAMGIIFIADDNINLRKNISKEEIKKKTSVYR